MRSAVAELGSYLFVAFSGLRLGVGCGEKLLPPALAGGLALVFFV